MKTMLDNGKGFPLQELRGTLERLTFQNEENGYTVARLIPQGKKDEVTIVGSLPGVNVGEALHLWGLWTTHTRFGRQFEVRQYTVELPATVEGVRKYLGSGLVKGIGPVTASNIVAHFGIETLDIIDNEVHRLREVAGIGGKRVYQIAQAWEEQKQIKEIMLFLQGHGVSTSMAVKIFKQYADESIQVVRTDPYRLARDIFGIGFKTADKIARQMGMPPDSAERIQAGLLYAMSKLSEEGHCFAFLPQLIVEAADLLEIQGCLCQEQVDSLIQTGDLVFEDEAVYLPPFYYAETGTAAKISRLLSTSNDRLKQFQAVNWSKVYVEMDRDTSTICLTDQQKKAVQMALTNKVSILTGGPGTGKSTITRHIINLLQAGDASVLLAAPTGRAAKRLSEATGLEAKTIHRLLEYSPSAGNLFRKSEENPLDTDLLIIDETSMVDILLMNRLVSAVEKGTHLLLVGDVDQLPSVGPGNVLKDLINSSAIAFTRLDTIFRQAKDSYIVVNAHHINRGEFPEISKSSKDFFLFSEEDAEKAADWVIELVTERIQRKFGFNPQEDIQVLSPMHRGAVGVGELNRRLQESLNPLRASCPEYRHGGRVFRQGDRVMQIRNDYDRGVFNGDMGRVNLVDLEEHLVVVDYDGIGVPYEVAQLDELVHAYAISIHKSQGSEYPVVVIPLLSQHYMMLQRNLLYTGVTRARKLVVLVGSKKAIAMAVNNHKTMRRNTRLAQRLKDI